MKKQNILKKTILSIILVIITFLAAMTYPSARTYEGLREVSASTDTSSSLENADWNNEVELTPNDEFDDNTVSEIIPTPDVISTPTMIPILETTLIPTPEVTPIPSTNLQSTDAITRSLLPSNATIVYNYNELTKALTEDNGFEIIYLGATISANSNGITIHPSKHSVVIDGSAPGSAVTRHTFYEFFHSNPTPDKTIHLSAENTSTKNITFQNIAIFGQNQNGVIFIPDNLSDVTVRYQNASYYGPQVVTNPRGTVQFVACNFNMEIATTFDSHYVAVANHIELDGATTISASDHTIQVMDAVFLPTYDNPQIDILRSANFRVNIKGFFLDIDTDTVNINIHQGATFEVNGESGFTPLGQNIKNMLIAENAYVSITQYDPQTLGTLRIEETLEMLPGSVLTIIRSSTIGSPIIFPTNDGRAIFNNPERVILFSPSLSSIDFENDGYIKIITSSINAWGMNMAPFKAPHYIWNNSGNKMLTVESIYKDGLPVSVVHSLDDNSPATDPLTPAEFDLSKIKVLTFGRITLSVDPIYTNSTAITGLTEETSSNFKVKVTADYAGLPTPLEEIEAANDGTFSFPIDPETLDPQNPITITTTFNDLSRREIVFPQLMPSGKLAFTTTPSNIDFNITTIPATPTEIMRTSGNFAFSVSDTRNIPKSWHVNASIIKPLTATLNDNTQVTLPNALIFVDEQYNTIPLSNVPLPIYSEDSLDSGDFDIFWDTDKGILLNVSPGNIYSNVTYSTTIYWDLVDAP